jgi:fatty-acyl-CoA synthase
MNASPADPTSLSDLIRNALVEHAEHVLVSDAHEVWTGNEIQKKVKVLQQILERHTRARDPILLCFPNSSTHAIALIATILADRVPVILSEQDFASAPEVWFNRSQPKLVFTNTLPVQVFLEAHLELPIYVLNTLCALETTVFSDALAAHSSASTIPEGTALVLFTSGSTGVPKGICIPASGIALTANTLIKRFSLHSDTITPVFLPICHSMALNTQFIPTLLAGGRSHFIDAQLELSRIFRTVLEQKSTLVALIAETLIVCAREREKRNLPKANQVRHVQLAGGKISEKHLELSRELFPNAIIHKGYGLTEGIRVTMIDSEDDDFHTDSVGFPLPFIEVSLRNDVKELIMNPMQVGEIWVKGPNTYLGLLGQEDSVNTDEPIATRDLGYWNLRQQLCIVGRDDGLFKFNGKRISASEIEKIPLELNTSVQNAKCVLLDDPKTGRPKIVLFIEISSIITESFQTLLNERLKQLAHPPKEIVFLTKFPTTSNGKVSLMKLKNFLIASPDENASTATLQKNGIIEYEKLY